LPAGKVLAGWKWTGDSDKNLIPGDYKVEGESANVEAVFADAAVDVASHAVTFHAEDGTFLQTVEYKSDQAFGLFSEGIAPEKDGYEFAGWTYGDDAHTPVKADDVVTGDWHVYASYVKKDAPVASHAVTFHAEDGTFLQTVEYKSDQAFGLFSEGIAPEKDGYEFAGWTYGDDAHTPVKADDVVTGDWHVYASYVKKDAPVASHAVTFHAEDGTFLQTVEYKSDQAFGLFSEGIAPEKDGYEFAGWTYGDDAHTPVKADDVVTGDWHVYASYVKKDAPQAKVFKVTFWDGLTWTEDAVVEVEEGKTVAAPTDPACEGFKFEGWFVDKALKEAYDFSAPVNGDMVLYAKWSKTAEAPKDEQKPVTPSDKNAGLPQTGDASMVAMGFAAASGAVLSAAGYFSSKRRKH
ncbi:InlB B-repeat-containing protein, partial [Collinsella intestinalis]|uniref:InlB B-repeat-containing protein n=1 Tax=Collinsella intestinalis TaxID=147207 RepID=UPI001260C9D8